ncbi:MAG: glycosyltransferase family 4 protein [Planctomycetes bacterium]|nr:glycosyltransferase family 4 protein [Planctomycetota bacterium]
MTRDGEEGGVAPRRCVMHVINGEHYSGAERVQDLLAQRLPEFGFDVRFACVKPGLFASSRQCRDAPLHEVPMRSRLDMRSAWRLANIVRQSGSVLLHAHTPRSLMVARVAAMLTGLPLVYHVHSPTSRDTTRAVRNWLNNTTERISLTGVDRLITVSQSLARHMRDEGFSPGRIVTVPNGVPAIESPPSRSTPRATWTIGTVALFRPRKGLEVLLESLAQLRDRSVPCVLRAVGPFETPAYESSVRRLATQLGVDPLIRWAGFTNDVPAELATMDLFVLPSLFGEGLPMVVLEAMAAGVPVVATRVEGVPEAIREGVDGFLATPADAEDLARAIESVVRAPDTWQTLSRNCVDRHARYFSDRRMAEQVAGVYGQVLAERCRPPVRSAT